jgi:Ser/Thr protein kinase RdoA (MazF antagonist)
MISNSIFSKWFKDINKDIRKTNKGNSTNNYIIENKYILRNAGTYIEYIEAQIEILNILNKELTYKVPKPLLSIQNRYLEKDKNEGWFMYEMIEGDTLLPNKSIRFGNQLAELHNSLNKINFENFNQMRSRDLTNTKKEINNLYKSGILNNTEVINSFKCLSQRFIDIYKTLPRIICQGDLNKDNFIVKNNKFQGLIDFGGIVIEPRIFDIQNFIFNHLITEKISVNKIRMFLKDYSNSSDTNISLAEKELIHEILIREGYNSLNYIIKANYPKEIINEKIDKLKLIIRFTNKDFIKKFLI